MGVAQIYLDLHLLCSSIIVMAGGGQARPAGADLINPLPFALVELIVEDGQECTVVDFLAIKMFEFLGQSQRDDRRRMKVPALACHAANCSTIFHFNF